MMHRDTKARLQRFTIALVTVLLITGTVVAGVAMVGAAATGDITFDEDDYVVEDGETVDVEVTVAPDDGDLDTGEVTLDVTNGDSDGDVIEQYTEPVEEPVAEGTEETFVFSVDYADVGDYADDIEHLEASAGNMSATTGFTVLNGEETDESNANVSIDTEDIVLPEDGEETEVNASVVAEDGPVDDELGIAFVATDENESETIVYGDVTDVALDEGDEETFTFVVNGSDVDHENVTDDVTLEAYMLHADGAIDEVTVTADDGGSGPVGIVPSSDSAVTDPFVIVGVLVVIGFVAAALRMD